ncbi:hypothetical protein KKD70_03180 [Patescibacteria group bacterium]|nr:hypothetical protein [Patescibacteria group bacterium]
MMKYLSIISTLVLVIIIFPVEAKAELAGVEVEDAESESSCVRKLDVPGNVWALAGRCPAYLPNGVFVFLEEGELEVDLDLEESKLISGSVRLQTSALAHRISKWGVTIDPDETVEISVDPSDLLVIYSKKGSTLVDTPNGDVYEIREQEMIVLQKNGQLYYRRSPDGNEEYFTSNGCSSIPGKQSPGSICFSFIVLGLAAIRRKRAAARA